MNRVAKRYAKALFELADDQNLLNQVESDLLLIETLILENEEFSGFLSNPLINDSDKLELMGKVLKSKISDLTFNFLNLLTEKKRAAFLADVIEEFKRMILEHQNTIEGELVSVVTLSEKQVSGIREHVERMTGKSVKLKQRLESGIIGGFIVKVEDLIIDNSIRYQLDKLREKMIAR